jgi:hypothetical protein
MVGWGPLGLILEIAGLTVLALAAFLLWRGAEETPQSIRSFSGKTETEQLFQKRRLRVSRLGLGLLVLGYVLQLIVRLAELQLRVS